ncbi:MAG: hypothetical protein AAF329_08630 [Cyanobacteria bacterium P01_A01_bin.17]
MNIDGMRKRFCPTILLWLSVCISNQASILASTKPPQPESNKISKGMRSASDTPQGPEDTALSGVILQEAGLLE